MEISAHFSEIQINISEEIKKAKYNIFVAVAWITDKSLWSLLEQKAEAGVVVQVVLVPDDINKNNKTDFNGFIESGGQLFWDDHHHKFCVIDVKTVITGSYNWTYMANNRGKRENIIVIKQNPEIAEQFSDEFKILLKQSEKYLLPKEIVYIEKEVEKIVEVEKVVEKNLFITRQNNLLLKTHDVRLNWWRQLNKEWKRIFSLILKKQNEVPSKNDLIELFQLTTLDLSTYEIPDITPLKEMGNLQTIIFSKINDKQKQELKKGLEGINIEIKK
jgi:phosphatidylserine/phosphatidylglycerophosphate/cardiolipin synthase-like enzyme